MLTFKIQHTSYDASTHLSGDISKNDLRVFSSRLTCRVLQRKMTQFFDVNVKNQYSPFIVSMPSRRNDFSANHSNTSQSLLQGKKSGANREFKQTRRRQLRKRHLGSQYAVSHFIPPHSICQMLATFSGV